MSKTFIVFMNAPKGSGKDEAADAIMESDRFFWCFSRIHLRFKDPLYKITAAIYGVSIEEMIADATDRATKEVVMDKYAGLSPRQALIEVSEDVIKPYYGKDFFGQYALDQIKKFEEVSGHDNRIVVFSDSGFVEEAKPIVDHFGEDCIAFRIGREGCTFEGDSRNWLPLNTVPNFGVIDNNGTLDEFKEKVIHQTVKFVDNRLGDYDGKCE